MGGRGSSSGIAAGGGGLKGLSENEWYSSSVDKSEFAQAIGKRNTKNINSAQSTARIRQVLEKAGFKQEGTPTRHFEGNGLAQTNMRFYKETKGITHQITVETHQGYIDGERIFYKDVIYRFNKT